MRSAAIVLFAIVLWNCSGNNNKTETESSSDSSINIGADSTRNTVVPDYESFYKLDSYLVEEIEDTTQVTVVEENCMFVVYPNDEQIAELEKINGEDFASILDDSFYYQSTAENAADTVGIKSIHVSRQFVRFVGEQGSWTLDVRKANLPEWKIILFNTKKEPKVKAGIDITTDVLRDYFDIKK